MSFRCHVYEDEEVLDKFMIVNTLFYGTTIGIHIVWVYPHKYVMPLKLKEK